MSPPAWHRGGFRIAEPALWTGAAAIVLTVHVGAAAWLMREKPIVAADDSPPAAIMIDLAPEPEAVQTEETEISENVKDAEESIPTEQLDSPEETPPEEVVEDELAPDPRPVEEVVENEPVSEPVSEPMEEEQNEPAEETTTLKSEVEVPLPIPKPRPPTPKRSVAEKPAPSKKSVQQAQKPRPKKQQSASNTTRKAKAQTRQSNRNAARQTSSGVSKAQQARWQSRLMAHLERRKRYPSDARRRGDQGTAYVRFRIDNNGNVQSVSLARSSGHPALDNEVLSLVRRASPVPKPPHGTNKTITAPVRFSRR